ncbi:MAG: hypothetical protein ACPGU1_02335 [Myxococcota bacterium]
MSGGLRHAWRTRRWFDLPLAILGVMLTVLGMAFFIFVSSVGAPVVPYGGLAVSIFGGWVGIVRPLRRKAEVTHSETEP